MKKESDDRLKFDIYKKALQSYQLARIRETYRDLQQIPEYKKLYHFFINQIYGPHDFGFRNQSIKTLHRRLSGILKGEIINAVGKVIELNDLSDSLDDRMAEQMLELGIGPELNKTQYREIYKSLDNYDERVYQIKLLADSVKGIHHISQMRFIGWSLKTVQKAAHLAGMGKIMDFLVEGYEAFRSVKNIEYFTRTLLNRELALNDELFGIKRPTPE
ncbi:MAG: hypothetical protein ACE5GL_02685 [Calditrichia bacterium]